MTPREIISTLTAPLDELLADEIVVKLGMAGYVILLAAEVEAIRDTALEEAASEAASWQETANKLAKTPSQKDRADLHMVGSRYGA